jgi:hypothetical protein
MRKNCWKPPLPLIISPTSITRAANTKSNEIYQLEPAIPIRHVLTTPVVGVTIFAGTHQWHAVLDANLIVRGVNARISNTLHGNQS